MANKKAVVVIDDSEVIRRSLKSALAPFGLKFKEAANGKEGLELCQNLNRGDPDSIQFILCDIMMPEMGGLDFLKAKSEDPQLKDIPVVMVSAESEQDLIMEAISLGAKGYATKPFRDEDLRKKLQKFI